MKQYNWMDEWGVYNRDGELVEVLLLRSWHRKDSNLVLNIFRSLPYLKDERLHYVLNHDLEDRSRNYGESI